LICRAERAFLGTASLIRAGAKPAKRFDAGRLAAYRDAAISAHISPVTVRSIFAIVPARIAV
jgi:hypothetical protein